MDVGEALKRARMSRQLTLQQVAQRTKINAHTLEALENNDFSRLPADVYVRGFLRAYAREVAIDPEDIVEEYDRQVEEQLVASAAVAPAESTAVEGRASRNRASTVAQRPVPVSVLVGTLVVIALGSYFVFAPRRQHETRTTAAASEAQAQAATPATAPPAATAVPPPADAARAANVAPETIRLDVRMKGPCWLSATTDRSPAFARLFKAGETQVVQAKDELVLRVGDPANITMTLNGAPMRPLGRAGQAVTVQINKQNYREYLAL